MATFKEAFAAARKEKGAGKTFTWNGKSYTTDYATEKKPSAQAPKTSPRPQAKPAAPKPKARPASLNPQSGAAQSGVKGKVKPKASPAAAPMTKPKARPAKATEYSMVRPEGKASGMPAAKMTKEQQRLADAKARRDKMRPAPKAAPKATPKAAPESKSFEEKHPILSKLGDIMRGGGFSNYYKNEE